MNMELKKDFGRPRPQLNGRAWLFGGITLLLAPLVAFCIDQLGSKLPIPPPPTHIVQLQPQEVAVKREKHEGLETAATPELRRLADYEAKYGFVTDELMLFSDMPTSPEEVTELSGDMTIILKEFAKYKIKPLVIFEPVGSDGPLDFAAYRAGGYDARLTSYFEALKAAGVTDETMGTWVLFSEANTPAWGSTTEPAIVADCITRTAKILKKTFPSSKVSLLLDSKTYDGSDTLWERGEYKSLVPYVSSIPKGLIDSLGLQGFPWSSPANEAVEQQFSPGTFLSADLLIEAGRSLEVKNVWFNSGSFSKMYTRNGGQTISASPRQRQDILGGVLAQVQKARDAGFGVSLNIFSADKSEVGEAIDWSYNRSADDHSVLRQTMADLQQQSIHLSIFDSVDPR